MTAEYGVTDDRHLTSQKMRRVAQSCPPVLTGVSASLYALSSDPVASRHVTDEEWANVLEAVIAVREQLQAVEYAIRQAHPIRTDGEETLGDVNQIAA